MCRKRSFATHADRLRPRLENRRLPVAGPAARRPCRRHAMVAPSPHSVLDLGDQGCYSAVVDEWYATHTIQGSRARTRGAEQVEAVLPTEPGMTEVVADKDYHSNETMVDLAAVGVRSYIAAPDRGRRCWKGAPEARDAVYANRRRIRGNRGRELLRRRGELLKASVRAPYRGWQPRAASASSDRRRHAPWPPRAGRVVSAIWALISRLVGLWGGLERGLGAVSARFAVHSFATAASMMPAVRPFKPSI